MSLYIRKYVKVGPLRFNLSKSGIGVSGGVRGLRVGTGPRGNYVHMGRGGLYYRKSLGSGHVAEPLAASPTNVTPTPVPSDDVVVEEIESVSVLSLSDSCSADLLSEIRQKQKRIRLFPLSAIASVIGLVALLLADQPLWFFGVMAAVLLAVNFYVQWRDDLRKSVVVFYDLDELAESVFSKFHEWFDHLARCACVWHVSASGKVRDQKYHAGAGTLVQRSRITPRKASLPFLRTNIDVPQIEVGKQTLAFLPDRLLVFEGKNVGAVSYSDLAVDVSQTNFVEEGGVPADSQVVGQTWKYVNKKGGPDRRFKDNRQLPIALYEEIHFKSPTGLNELIQVSRIGVGDGLESAIRSVGSLAAGNSSELGPQGS